jgi:hypothetical protein
MKSSKLPEGARAERKARITVKRARMHLENGVTWLSKGRWNAELKMFTGTAMGTMNEAARRKHGGVWAKLT